MNEFLNRYGLWIVVAGAVGAIVIEAIEIVDFALAFTSAPFAIIRAIAFILLGIGAWYLHTRQLEQGGRLSLIGSLVMLVAYIFTALFILSLIGAEMPDRSDPMAAMNEWTANNTLIPIVLLFGLLGPLVFGIAVVRAQVYPRWMGILLAISPFLGFVVFAGIPIIIAQLGEMLGPLVLGIMAWSVRDNPASNAA